MSQLMKKIGGTALVALLLVIVLPSFAAKISFVMLVLIAGFGIYAVQPKPQPVRVRKNDRRN
ncbi:hypothetical protein [Enterococcus sp. AZ109]|uniref:hypothetical protein n=1 Tax=Enterococcus sp. AZ109 TaxID=2774634 RepID=UPI003F23D263